MKTHLPADLAARYERDGFVILSELLSAKECDTLKTEAQRLLAEKAKPGASVFLHVAVASAAFRALAEDPRLVAPLRQVMPHGVMFMSDKLVYKSADKTFSTPWHIDCFYWRNTRPKLSVWIPLDDAAAENGTLTVVPGSHKRDWQMVKKGLPNGEFGDEVSNGDWREGDVVTCAIKRGSAIIFSDRLVHGSTRNTAGKDRYAIISTYHAPAADEPFDLDFPARKVLVAAGA
ncbi:phytanoyl-CoA dioxygenase family protein [Horticoccus luteus]|uniref:Phytanoyl-CoA dioxygenase family protein n=1 Tax=Horticoccus luteus TaxID=2862869 RepID=A0A8F9XGG7_9BACT|nr:phytanoyl-CoA dioxygenase family protein [Horticoccus luteus]QYM78205.1 phytanoyl-CoA dioxygenase family protein [Horticoccus luteus]